MSIFVSFLCRNKEGKWLLTNVARQQEEGHTKYSCFPYSGISKTCILNVSTASSGVEKYWPLILFLTYGNKKKSFGVKSGLYVGWLIKSILNAQKCSWMSSHCFGEDWSVFGDWFSWFLGTQLANKWLCTTQNWLFCVVLMVRLRHVQFFRKNRRSFAWKCFVREQLLLDLAHLETLIVNGNT